MKTISEKESMLCEKIIYVFEMHDAMPEGIVAIPIKNFGFALLGLQDKGNEIEISDMSEVITEGKILLEKLWDLKSFDMQLATMMENGLDDPEFEEILAAMTKVQKKEIEYLRMLLWNEIFNESETCLDKRQDTDIEKCCSTCKCNVEFPPAHTCDVCTSLDEENYCMWKQKE